MSNQSENFSSYQPLTPVEGFIPDVFRSAGQETMRVEDLDLAYAILAKEEGEDAFVKTKLEAIFLKLLLTPDTDQQGWGTPFGHFRPDRDWQIARHFTNHLLNMGGETREQKADHRGLVNDFADEFFAERFGEGTQSIDNKAINANDLARDFSSGYIMAILFKDGSTLDSKKIAKLSTMLGRAQQEVFALYTLAHAKNTKWGWLAPAAFNLIKVHFNYIRRSLMKLVKETLKAHPDSYFNQAVASYQQKLAQEGGVMIGEDEKVGQGITTISAGLETTAAEISFGVRELAINSQLADQFFNGEISTKDFVDHIVTKYSPAELFRVSPDHEVEINGVKIPPNTILRMYPAELHARKAAGEQRTLSAGELITFGKTNTARICAGYGIAMRELILFFDRFKERVALVEYVGKPENKDQLDLNLANRPKEPWVRILLKK